MDGGSVEQGAGPVLAKVQVNRIDRVNLLWLIEGNAMIIRATFLILLMAFLSACVAVDGAYVQKEGARIDYQKVDKLIKGASTISEAITALGEPSRRYVDAGDVEVLEYVSVKTRDNYEKTLGLAYGRVTQSLRETVTLTFAHGVFSSKEEREIVY